MGFESWLERDRLMLLDFDPAVVGIASQPLRLHWCSEDGRRVSHVPDYFARRADGSAVMVDCRPVDRRAARDVVKFEASAAACARIGWEYELLGAPDPVLVGNVRWLAGYRHPRHDAREIAAALCDVFAMPTPLIAGAAAVGDPIVVLPVLFHLVWRGDLSVDLSIPVHAETRVCGVGRR